ncbi:glutamate racemase [Alicyclobacillus sp. TC]|uniref:Glutamate racemase n=1 Tax=Alicyclobacillus tolerans TaxID=90970 RepID=A0A1M6MIL7_9BACL|nr:glutamate racemase [Alicyclobacillus sp. TC]SHJ83351.1 glutamate racemase [Alicyclobacillus montanus]
MLNSNAPIGVFDSGIGGLTVATEIIRALPNESIIYVGDHARCPYGEKHADEVRRYAVEICNYFCALGVKLIVIACNTATAVALRYLQMHLPIPVLGVVKPGAEAAVSHSISKRIGVIGTPLTIESCIYTQAVHQLLPEAIVHSQACPAFVPLVEAGKWDGAEVESIVRQSLEPLLEKKIDTLILGCTHYPLLEKSIQKVIGPSIQTISSARSVTQLVHSFLSEREMLANGTSESRHMFYTTGQESFMNTVLQSWFGLSGATVAHLDIHESLQSISNL